MLTKHKLQLLGCAISTLLAASASAQIKGPSTASTPYVQAAVPGFETISILTVDNTGANPDDTVPKVGGGTYGMSGIPDGLGAFDNGDGTFTLLVNHELGGAAGVARAHGSVGSFVASLVINKNTLAVVSGEDLIKTVHSWNNTTQATGAPLPNAQFFRFCSADLAAPGAFFNPASGLGSSARIYLNGEEDTTHGWAMAHVATGPSKGNSYIMGKFNLLTNGSGASSVGAWETLVASPFAQDKTVVIGNNDGGQGIMNNALSVYVGLKQLTGTEPEKAGLMNGTLKHVVVTGNPVEVVNTTTRATSITNGTRFSLSLTASTVFSRPEDGAWNPKNPNEFYFVTTDVYDSLANGTGTATGQTRLWRLTFDDITNPDLGGKIDLLINGRTVGSDKVNMFDNLGVNEKSGRILLQEDVGNQRHNGKIWEYDPATDALRIIVKHDAARFGEVGGQAATSPYTQDEETTGIIDITSIMAKSALHRGNTGESWYISADQAHYTSGTTTAQAEGGQIFMLHDLGTVNNIAVARGGLVRDRRTGLYAQVVTVKNNNATALNVPLDLVIDGLSPNATVANAAGATTVNPPLGSPYVNIPVGPLAAGASASVTVSFTNPTNAAITYTTRVLHGVAVP